MPKSSSSNSQLYNNELQHYLKANRAVDFYTHTSIGIPKGSYFVKCSETSQFMDLYHKVVFERKIPTYLTEGIRDIENTPLKIDLDFRYYSNKVERKYTFEDIAQICQKYMEIIEEYLDDPEDDERLFYILEKPCPTTDKDKTGADKKNDKGELRIKDGVHILAPGIVTVDYLQLKFREYVYKNCGDVFDKYGFDNSYSDIFDRAVIDRNNWQMYGSTKPNQPPYLVSKIIRVFKDSYEIIDNIPDTKELIHILSVRNKFDASLIKVDKEDEVHNANVNKPKVRHISKRNKKKATTFCNKRELSLIHKYVNCLSVDRATNYQTWIEVGWCLHNLHNKDNTLLNLWIEFSAKAAGYSETCKDDCSERWEDMHDEGLGIGSLKLWAKEDNEQEYKRVVSQDLYSHVIKACKGGKGSSFDVATIMNIMYKDDFICVSVKDDKWFYYDKDLNRWLMDDKGIRLKEKISTEVWEEFNRFQISESQKALDDPDGAESIPAINAQNISKVMNRLKDTPFKANIMTECKEVFYDKERIFLDKLDSYNYLIGFKNGVYDLKRDEFRTGRPEDYISKSTNINYVDYNPQSPEVMQINDFYKKILVIESVRKYLLIRSASFLSGSTKDESFDIYSGKGGNGKSKHMELMEAVFGDYAVKLPITLLTGKRACSTAANPELAKTKGARLCSMQEPDEKTKINVGLMKELTGGDKISARALYSEPIEFKPQFKMVLCCNDKPELPEHDEGTWRRVRNTEFASKFTYPNDIDIENVLDFPRDDDLAERFEDWAEPFMSILIHYHKIYKEEGLRVPDEIIEYTSEYREKNNHFRDFINERISHDPNSSVGLPIHSIYSAYKEWYSGINSDRSSIRTRKDLQSYFNERYGKYHSPGVLAKDKGYRGLSIVNLNGFMNNEDCSIDDEDELDN
jgi:P4 family phage/plasmid primase-like protien